jgi:tRNA (guanine37-N1)-methyltransferase
VKDWCKREFDTNFTVVSLGQYVTLWGEVPAMCVIESTARLVPGVIKEEVSRQDESYRPEHNLENIEYPQYTRPQEVEWFCVPEVLLSGHHEEIRKWREVS